MSAKTSARRAIPDTHTEYVVVTDCFEEGRRVATQHFQRTIVGTVRDIKARGMFSVSMVLVDWDEFGEVWESPDSLEVAA